MRYRSKKQEELYKQRRPLVIMLLQERAWCEACPVYAGLDGKTTYIRRTSVDVHEIVNRSQGGSILEEKNLLTVCRECHRRITENPHEAEIVGLHLPGWATDQMFAEASEIRVGWAHGNGVYPSWL